MIFILTSKKLRPFTINSDIEKVAMFLFRDSKNLFNKFENIQRFIRLIKISV